MGLNLLKFLSLPMQFTTVCVCACVFVVVCVCFSLTLADGVFHATQKYSLLYPFVKVVNSKLEALTAFVFFSLLSSCSVS